jgi:type IV pilus assembly protein PilV
MDEEKKVEVKKAEVMTNAKFSAKDSEFIAACELEGLKPTARQASRWRSKRGKAYKASKGFSLLEVLIGLMILSIGMLGIAAMTTTSIQTNANANHLTEAMNIGQAQMEKLKITPWGTLANGSNGTTSKTGVAFSNTWSITTTGNLKNVTLVTSWVDRTNTHMLELKTKIAR